MSAPDARVCPTCGGTYLPFQADGMEYFHACPLVTNPDFQPNGRLPKYDARETIAAPGHVDERYDTSGAHDLNVNPRPQPAPRIAPAAAAAVQDAKEQTP
jgi:hypothetical protein